MIIEKRVEHIYTGNKPFEKGCPSWNPRKVLCGIEAHYADLSTGATAHCLDENEVWHEWSHITVYCDEGVSEPWCQDCVDKVTPIHTLAGTKL